MKDQGVLYIWLFLVVANVVAGCYFPRQLPTPRFGTSIAALNDKLYYIGSRNATSVGIIDIFNTVTKTWEATTLQLDPPRTGVRPLGVGTNYLVLIGGLYQNSDRHRFIEIIDVANNNEKISIPLPSSWSQYANPAGINVHLLQKLVVYAQSGALFEQAILIIDPATKSVVEFTSNVIQRATTNGTHVFAFTRHGPRTLDVEQMVWSELSNFPVVVPSTHPNSVVYMPVIDALAIIPNTPPPTFHFYGMNGTEIRVLPRARFSLLIHSDADIYLVDSGALTVIRVEDFEQIQYHMPQTFFDTGISSLLHNGIIYATSIREDNILTINTNALFIRAQFNVSTDSTMVTAGDILIYISDNISWFDMNTRQFRTWDWPTRRNLGPVAVVGQYVVLAGGIDRITNEPSNVIDIFDTTTQIWTSNTMPYSFRAGRFYTIGEEVFFFSGQNQLYIVNVKANTWRNTTITQPFGFHVVHNTIFASYGIRFEMFDLTTGQVTRTNMTNVQGTIVGSDLYFGVDVPTGIVFMYNVATNSEKRDRLSVARTSFILAVVQDRHVIIAGGTPRNRVDVYDIMTATWNSTQLPDNARNADILMTVVNDVVIIVRQRRIEQLNPATMELSEIVLEVDDITRVHTRGSKVIFVGATFLTIFETSTREYFTARFDTFTVNDPLENFVLALSGNRIEYRAITTMTGVMTGAILFEGASTLFSTSARGPHEAVTWSHNDDEIVDVTGQFNLTLNSVTQSDNGNYRVEVRDLCNQRMQQQARLTVHRRPMFVEPLHDTIDLCDEPAVIETQVEGKNMTLEWRIDGHVQPSMTSENITIAPSDLECDMTYSLCLTATNPSGPNTTCASLKLVKVDSLFTGPWPLTTPPQWFTGTQVDLSVSILNFDCTSHSWLVDNQIVSQHDTLQSVYRVNVSQIIQGRQFTVVAQCGNSEIRSRPFVFTDVSSLKVEEVIGIVVLAVTVAVAAIVTAVFVRRRLVKSQSTEVELQTLLTQAKTDSLRRDGVSVIPSTKWEWTPSDDFTYRPVDALPCKIDLSMIQMKTEPMRIDVWMQNEMIFSYGAKSTNSSLKERLLDGLQVDIYSPQSPKYEIKVEPSSFVIKEGKSVHVTVSSMMRMTAKCKISLVLVLDQHKMYSAVEYKIESMMSTWIDLDEIQLTGQYLGGGGFGSVTRGVYRGQQVAVKKLLSQYLTPDMKTEFEREVTLMKDLRHPNIVSFVGASNVDDNLAIVLEYAPLGSLSSTMQKMKLSTSMKLTVLYETAKAIQFLHMNSVIHRDIKPQNILVFSLEPKSPVHIKLTDFGTSRFISEDKMTVTKNVGTISYMAPEALGRNPRIDKSADVYSFAILMWEVMFEQQPFAEFEWDSAIEQHVKDGKRVPLSTDGSVNMSLVTLIEECWKQEPSSRPQINSVVERLSLLMQQIN